MTTKINDKDLQQFKKILIEIRLRLNEEIRHINDDTLKQSSKDSAGDLSGYSLHMADQATDNYDREFLLSLANSEREVLHRIDEAIKRVEDKTFGTCLECPKSIPKTRLKAIPFAELCIECQEKREKTQGRPNWGV